MSDDQSQNEEQYQENRRSADYARERMGGHQPPPRKAGGSAFRVLTNALNSDASTRWLVYGTAGLGGLLLVSIGGWALLGHHQGGIPVIGPPSVAMRTKPVDPGGMQLDNMIVPEADDGQAHLTPGPEKPNPGGLAEQYGQSAEKPDTTAGSAGASPDVAGAPAGTEQSQTPPAAPDTSAVAQNDDKAAAGVMQPADSQDPVIQSDALPAPETPEAPVDDKTPPQAPIEPVKKAPEKKVVTATQPVAPASSGGKYQVQLAALQSPEQAMKEWTRLQTRYSDLFGSRKPSVEKIQRDNAIFYRLRVTGFASSADTRAFCSAVRERGLACTQVH